MFEKFTEMSKQTLFLARYEASRRGSAVIGTEHVLLGLLKAGDPMTIELFARAGVAMGDLQAELERRNPLVMQEAGNVEIPFSEDTKSVLLFAEEEAARMKRATINGGHQLAGLLRFEAAGAGGLLTERGLRLAAVRNDVVARFKRPPQPGKGVTMSTFLNKYSAQFYALMRIVVGLLFLMHGSQKLFGFPAAAHEPPPFIKYGGGSIELIGGLLVMLGLFTDWAAFLASGEMAVAYWYAHAAKNVNPLLSGGELAALYCFVLLFIAAHGAGIWSLDAVRGRPGGAGRSAG